MSDLPRILDQYGHEKQLSTGEVLLRQGSVSDGVYYLKRGLLGVYMEQEGKDIPVTKIMPGKLVGELGATTGRTRTATVKAEEESVVIHVSVADYQKALQEAPGLAAEIVRMVGDKLMASDVDRISLGRSYRQAMDRVQTLHTEKAQLEELLRLREELGNTIVHDLRNPLSVISAGLAVLQRAQDSPEAANYAGSIVETMDRSVKRMRNLVDTLIDIARLEEDELTLQLEALDLCLLAEDLIADEAPLAEEEGIELECRLGPDVPKVLGDPNVIQRIILNLVDNALKFTPSGGKVWIEVDPGPNNMRVEVIDTGPGIPVAERERIFEKFTQVQGRKGSRQGSGLGLAFCHMAVEAHGGNIWVEDGPDGKGSRFVFTLPYSNGNP